MMFESLANELLLDVFEFLNGVQLLHTFHGLNSRFDNLLVTHFRTYLLDFRSVSKIDFENFGRQNLPSIVDPIVSLVLSDGDKTPQQTAYLLSHNLNLGWFNNLQSLLLSDIRSHRIMDNLMDELTFLSLLIRLSVIDCYFRSEYIDSVWHLPKLTNLNLDSSYYLDESATPTVVSLSLENVVFRGTIYQSTVLERLFEYTPYLRRLSIGVLEGDLSQQLSLRILSIEILEWSFKNSIDALENLVQYMRHLSELTVEMERSYVNGYQWENIIIDHLPKLKIFQLLMHFQCDVPIGNEEHIDSILDSFRTSFWIDERQWFVRCHCNKKSHHLYTLPYAFSKYLPDINARFKSTCSHDDDYYSYDRVHSFSYKYSLSGEFLQFRFSNLYHLDLSLPIEDQFWPFIPTLNRLRSLSVEIFIEPTAQSQLQALLDKAPRLYSLKLYSTQSVSSSMPPIQLRSKSIRRLDYQSTNSFFNQEKCHALICSPLSTLCEVLLIKVENRGNILLLANNMENLRTLNVHCQYVPMGDEDKLMKSLQRYLPVTCTISRVAYHHYILWIR